MWRICQSLRTPMFTARAEPLQEFCRERPQHCAVVGRGAVASHYSYYTQRSGLGTQTDVLRQYRDIAMSVCGELVRSCPIPGQNTSSRNLSTGSEPTAQLFMCRPVTARSMFIRKMIEECHSGLGAVKVTV